MSVGIAEVFTWSQCHASKRLDSCQEVTQKTVDFVNHIHLLQGTRFHMQLLYKIHDAPERVPRRKKELSKTDNEPTSVATSLVAYTLSNDTDS